MKKPLAAVIATVMTASALMGCSVKRETPTASAGGESPAGSAAAETGASTADVPSLEGKRIGISIIGTDHHWDRSAYEAAVAQVEALGGEPIATQAGRNTQQHISDIENLIQQKPDAIVSILGDAAALEPVFAKVREAEIPLFTMDQPSPHSVNNVTSDNYYIGEALAREIAEGMDGEGKILAFNGFQSVRVCQIRYNMLVEVLKDYPGVEIIKPELQDVPTGTVEDARRKMTDALSRYPEGEIDAVWACWDIPMIGAAQAVDQAGRDEIRVYGIDGDPTAVDMIADPNSSYTATMAQQPAEIGKTSINNVAMYLGGQEEQVDGTTYFEPVLVTKENVAETRALLFGESQ